MEPMKPMKPMRSMEPMSFGEPWWPSDLGDPASAGSQNGMRYAFFPDARRLLVERHGNRQTYDSGDHRISSVSQQSGAADDMVFSSQHGSVGLDALKMIG